MQLTEKYEQEIGCTRGAGKSQVDWERMFFWSVIELLDCSTDECRFSGAAEACNQKRSSARVSDSIREMPREINAPKLG
ncbi:hypothetical protein [Gordonia sp. N1V]|uniref:hypothetical protein n=1 Tax=Gordonia sp. N1V TaxID=3034163 RepID=UPI0023E2B036|nr:hypothetical protein [Gordonia sp. N1V]MDF3285149.1 hypothetical protein [Gordonia sp. N1V]